MTILLPHWRRLAFLALLVCTGCRSQAPQSQTPSKQVSPEVSMRVETMLRATMNVPPHIKVEIGERTPSSQFPGLDDLPVTFIDGERKMPVQFVMSRDEKTLFQLTKYDVSAEALQKKQDERRKIMDKVDVSGRPVRGGQNAKVLIVSYDDLQCPFCTQMHRTLFPAVLTHYGEKIKIVYKDFPLEKIHPWAMHAAVDSNCLTRQNHDAYWAFVDYVHDHQGEISGQGRSLAEQQARLDAIATDQAQAHGIDTGSLQSCIKKDDETIIKAALQEGESLGIDSTPTVFVNGEKINGALSIEDMEKVIDAALVETGDTVTTSSKGSGAK